MNKQLTVEILATPNPKVPEGYDFEMQFKGKKTKCLTFNKNDDGMKKEEDYRIDFNLKNMGDKKDALRFSKNRATVLWAKPVADIGDECPNTECHMDGVFYVDPDEKIKDEKLKVINVDPDIQLFKFAFNFLRPGQVDGPDTDYARYDPIGSNQNGGLRRRSSALVTWVLVGVGAAAIAFFAVRAWSR